VEILSGRGLVPFSDCIEFGPVPFEVEVDGGGGMIKVMGPVGFVGGKDPYDGYAWLFQEQGGSELYVGVDDIGSEVCYNSLEEAASRICQHVSDPASFCVNEG
jgi:glucose dehydrogenase